MGGMISSIAALYDNSKPSPPAIQKGEWRGSTSVMHSSKIERQHMGLSLGSVLSLAELAVEYMLTACQQSPAPTGMLKI